MLRNVFCAGFASLALAAAAVAQVHQVVFELDLDDPQNSQEVDTCVAANAKRAIVATNQRLSIHDLDGTNPRGSEMDYVWAQNSSGGLSTFPDHYLFKATDSGAVWRDPRVEWDPIHGRFWITIFDVNDLLASGRRFHVAVSRDDSPSTFDVVNGSAGDWYVYTGDGTGGAHGAAFHLASLLIDEDLRFQGIPDHQVISIDQDHLWMVSRDLCYSGEPGCGPTRGSVVSIPLEDNALSIMDGHRPSEADFGIVHVNQNSDPLLRDFTVSHYAVQEPFDQFAAAQFTINYAADASSGPTGYRDAIRLGAARWVSGALDYQWKDLTIDAASDRYFHRASNDPGTPKQDWNIKHINAVFDSGVLFRDGDNNWRILAAHHVGVDSDPGGTPTQSDVTEFRWYLIDPDLDNYPGANSSRTAPVTRSSGGPPQGTS